MIFKNRVFKLRNVQKWAVSSLKGVDLLKLRNRETFRNGHADIKGLRISDAEESTFQACKRSYMGSAVLQCGRLNDIQELRFETAKSSDMWYAVL